jgi:pyruvate dehydrogenase E1 component beta subunit
LPLGKAAVVSPGHDVTLVTWSAMRFVCEQAVASATAAGLSVELIDLRTLWPWDRDTVLGSVARTRRLVIAHEAVQVAGVGAEIAASVVEALGTGIAVRRIGAPRIPVAYAPNLEAAYHTNSDQVLAALQQIADAR